MPKARVYQDTDSTNVYGYLVVEPLDEYGRVICGITEQNTSPLPKAASDACRYQWPQVDCVGLNQEEKEIIALLQKLGWEVLDKNYNPIERAD